MTTPPLPTLLHHTPTSRLRILKRGCGYKTKNIKEWERTVRWENKWACAIISLMYRHPASSFMELLCDELSSSLPWAQPGAALPGSGWRRVPARQLERQRPPRGMGLRVWLVPPDAAGSVSRKVACVGGLGGSWATSSCAALIREAAVTLSGPASCSNSTLLSRLGFPSLVSIHSSLPLDALPLTATGTNEALPPGQKWLRRYECMYHAPSWIESKDNTLEKSKYALNKILSWVCHHALIQCWFPGFYFELCHGNGRCLPEWKLGERPMRACSTSIATFTLL